MGISSVATGVVTETPSRGRRAIAPGDSLVQSPVMCPSGSEPSRRTCQAAAGGRRKPLTEGAEPVWLRARSAGWIAHGDVRQVAASGQCDRTSKHWEKRVDLRLELIVLPVSDIDRAKAFYESAGFLEEFDAGQGATHRVVQLRPPGSPTSILIGDGIIDSAPGSVRGLQLVVVDVEAARAGLVERGVEVGPVFHDLDGAFYHASPAREVPGRDPAGRDHASFARFADPDGNEWVLHEVRSQPSVGPDGASMSGKRSRRSKDR